MSAQKFIRNVNILDIRNATPEAVAEISGIGNANLVLYSPETAGLLSALKFGNLNKVVEVPRGENIKMTIGPMTVRADFFERQPAGAVHLVVGPLTFEPDVTAEQVEKGSVEWIVVGPVTCPETLAGAIQSSMRVQMGPVRPYPVLKTVRKSSLELDLAALNGLEDHTEMTVIGALSMPDVLPNDLLEQKIRRIFVVDQTTCRGENAAAIKSRLVDGSGPLEIVPAGFEAVAKPLTLDSLTLQTLKARKLFCKERVVIDAEVTPAQLEEGLDALHSQEMIVCPKALQAVLARKCDLLENQVVFYEGALWLAEGSHVLYGSYLDTLEGPFTLVVTGELTIDPAVDEKALAARLAKVHNLGQIRCTPRQMGVVQARLGLHDGSLEDSSQAQATSPDENQIGNANYLAL